MQKFVTLLLFSGFIMSTASRTTRVHRISQDHKQKFIRIEVETEPTRRTKEIVVIKNSHQAREQIRKLRRENRQQNRRIRDLERAVVQLQEMVDQVQHEQLQFAVELSGEQYACVVKTSFNGQFLGKAATKLEAQTRAQQACKSKVGNFRCVNQPISCESA